MKNEILLTLSLLMLSSATLADVKDEIKQTFNVNSSAAEFRLNNVNGDVDIIGWKKDIISVTAIITAEDQEGRNRIEVDMQENSRGVSVETRYKKTNWNNNSSGSVDYEVNVPVGTRLSDIELVNGSLTIKNVSGAMKLQTVNGGIDATGLANNSEISSVNGSVDVSYIDGIEQLDDISIETVNGRVVLSLPANINADVEVETMHGSIKNDFGLSAKKNMFTGRSLEGMIGSGDVQVDIETVNGSVKIKKN
ncbi:DUF4097 family beta strand repeat-containing protein [Thalassotalea sp. PP2-459]|uniref:DUF4097 family beta strand repeat-containing protein n=1 Tax=Thalassotalea sp. PP2-459 TaxID=1742724 RepID=UPI0009422487|nr:DUF4097 family beta strand repeat-containing protein [Thalassotalea sp. PP2-459]OKY24978.1 hypothetical protein BI291_17650 [Thalassotalea sp. PP2-459]